MSNELGEAEPQCIEISFGDVFENTFEERTRTYIVTDVGEETWFTASVLVTLKSGKKGLFGGGTTSPEDVHSMTGERWGLEKILDAFHNYALENWGEHASEEIVKILTESSNISSRVITY
jgi:hypothetical protein